MPGILDYFSSYTRGLTGPLTDGFDVTPNDGANLPAATRAISVTTDGTVAVVMLGGQAMILTLAAGVSHPYRVMRILATGTTATGIQGFY